MGDAADDTDPGSALELCAERPVADEDELVLAAALERLREAEDVLPLGEPAQAEEGGSGRVPADHLARLTRVARSEALEIDPAVDDLGLAARAGRDLLEARAKPVRDRDHGRSPSDDVARRCANARARRVRDVLAVGGNDERRPRSERCGESRGHEEVRVHDVGTEPPRRAKGVAREHEMAPSASCATIEHSTLELMPARGELALEVRDEDAEIRVVRPRIHLGDEEDAQGSELLTHHAQTQSRGQAEA